VAEPQTGQGGSSATHFYFFFYIYIYSATCQHQWLTSDEPLKFG